MAKEQGPSYESFTAAIKRGDFAPIYFLFGEEEYFIDQIEAQIEAAVLTESEKAFNHTIFYGRDASPQSIIETCRRLPMMSERQLVVIREAQSFKEIDLILPYLKKPVRSTILVIENKHGSTDKRKAFGKEILALSQWFESKPLSESSLAPWIKKYVQERGCKIEEEAVELLAEFTGPDLSKLSNEIGKLLINKVKGGVINTAEIEAGVGISKDYTPFALSNALLKRDEAKVHQIVNYFVANPRNGPLPLILGTLLSSFSKAWVCSGNRDKSDYELAGLLKVGSFFAKDYKLACAKYPVQKLESIFYVLEEYDLRFKGIHNYSTGEGELLREMVVKILS